MRFIDDTFPLLVVLHGARFDAAEMRDMVEGYERYFERGARYTVLIVSPGIFVRLGARERKLIGAWVNDPRVRELSGKLCVGSATVVPSAMARGALTAILWFWTPPWPNCAVSTVEEGLDFCIGKLADASLPLPRPTEEIRAAVLGMLRESGQFAPSLSRP
jgi:hypothetical protein